MFGTNNWPALVAFDSADEGRPRAAPPSATPLDFPQYIPTTKSVPFTESSKRRFLELFLSIRNPSEVTSEHLKALNIELDTDVTLNDLIPSLTSDGEPQFPSEQSSMPDANTLPISPNTTLSNGTKAPAHNIYTARRQELLFDNEDAFRDIQRLPALPDRPPARPVHFRKFWVNLELASQYWDTSMDNAVEYNDKTAQQAQSDPGTPDRKVSTSHLPLAEHSGSKAIKGNEDHPTETGSNHQVKMNYTGRRIGTGREMPEQYREDAVRYFIEAIAWQFGCQIRGPTMNPRLLVQKVLFPVRHSSIVYRVPTDRARARAGNLEGPLMGVQCRPTTKFRETSEAVGEGIAEKVDLLREVAAMLHLAQERAREGVAEKKPGEGQWWTTAPRWGATEGGTSGNETGSSEKSTPTGPGDGRRRVSSKRRHDAGRSYRIVRPGSGLWDKRITYARIGSREDSRIDDIFMVSSVNHHVSILRLRVHSLYLQFLETGMTPPSASSHTSADGGQAGTRPTSAAMGAEMPWYVLKLQRSRWYDLLSVQDRVEAVKGIWGILTWLMRDDRGDVEMTDVSDA